MATRSGSVDPGMLLWLLERENVTERSMAAALEHDSGLVGLAGCADMKEILRRAEHGDDRAALALDVYLHRLRAGIAAMSASLGGIDVVAFTGGVGERAPEIRRRAASGTRLPRPRGGHRGEIATRRSTQRSAARPRRSGRW